MIPHFGRKWSDFMDKARVLTLRLRLIQLLGGQCLHGGENDPVVLVFDHIKDDGYLERKGQRLHVVAKNPAKFQLLCHNCNWRKEYWRRKSYRRGKDKWDQACR